MFKLATKGFIIASVICILLFFMALHNQNFSTQFLEDFGIFVSCSIVCSKLNSMDENIESLKIENKLLKEDVRKLQAKK